MKANINNRNSKTKRRKIICWIYRVLPFILIVLISVGTFRIVLAIMLKNRLNAIRAAGYPATLAELNEYYPQVPDDENAAILYEEAFAHYHGVYDDIFSKEDKTYRSYLKFAKKILPAGMLLGEPSPKGHKAASKKFITVNAEVITLLKKAVKLPKCNFPVKFYKNHTLDITLDINFTNAVELLATEAIVAAQDKNRALVVEDILTMLKICQALDNYATGYSAETRHDMQSIAVKAIEHLLSMIEFDSNSLVKLQLAFEANLDKNGERKNRALACERIIAINLEKFSDSWYDFSPGHQRDVIFMYKIFKHFGIDTLNQLKILEIYEELLALDKTDIKAVKSYTLASEKQLRKLSILYVLAIEQIQHTGFFLYERFIADTQLKEAIVGMAIERYQLKYGQLPKKLNQLVPEFIKKLPNDPFTGQPFRYIVGDIEIPLSEYDKFNYAGVYNKDGNLHYLNGGTVRFIKRRGWMIYSFGQDGDDDNGIPRGILNGKGDITFRCLKQ